MTSQDERAENWLDESEEAVDPHLAASADITEAADFVLKAIASGLIGMAIQATLTALRKRFGRARMTELKHDVYAEMKKLRRKPNVTLRDLKARVDRVFEAADI